MLVKAVVENPAPPRVTLSGAGAKLACNADIYLTDILSANYAEKFRDPWRGPRLYLRCQTIQQAPIERVGLQLHAHLSQVVPKTQVTLNAPNETVCCFFVTNAGADLRSS